MTDEIETPDAEDLPPEGDVSEGDAEDDLLDDQADAAEEFVEGLLEVMGLGGTPEADFEDDDLIMVTISGDDLAVLIGRHGATLEALQELTRAAVSHATSSHAFLMVDIEGYRERQRERVRNQARRIADRVQRSGRPERMEPMSSYERKLVHDALTQVEGVRTESEGDEPYRRVVVRPA